MFGLPLQAAATPTSSMPSVQVVYSASHIESIPDSIVSSISTPSTSTSTALTFSPSPSSTASPHPSTSTQAPLPPPPHPGTIPHHSLIAADASAADYLNPPSSSIMAPGLGDPPGHSPHEDLASQLINQYAAVAAASEHSVFDGPVNSGDVAMATTTADSVSLHVAGSTGLNS